MASRSPPNRRRCCSVPASPWSNRRRRISAAVRPAPTTCCSRRSPRGCANASSATCAPPSADLIAAGNIGCITQLAGGGTAGGAHGRVARLDGRWSDPVAPVQRKRSPDACTVHSARSPCCSPRCRRSRRTPAPPATNARAALDKLLGALKSAPSEEIAGPLEQQIRQLWLNSGTPAVTLLMSRGLREMKADAQPGRDRGFLRRDHARSEPGRGLPPARHRPLRRRRYAGRDRRHPGDAAARAAQLRRIARRLPRSPRRARTGRAPTRPGRRCWRSIPRPPAARSA